MPPIRACLQSVDDLKKLNKNKKLVKKLAKKYDAFLASGSLIKQIPRLLGCVGMMDGGVAGCLRWAFTWGMWWCYTA